MNVNQKGTCALFEVMRDLHKLGYECFLPVHDYSAIDLIAFKNYTCYKLQIKYREEYRNKIEIPLSSVVNGKKIPIDLNKIDGWAIYCPNINKVVYINKKEISGKCICFKLSAKGSEKSNKNKPSKLYTDFGGLSEWSKLAHC